MAYYTDLLDADNQKVPGHADRRFKNFDEIRKYLDEEIKPQFHSTVPRDTLEDLAEYTGYQDNEIDLVYPGTQKQYTGMNLSIEGSPDTP